MEAVLEVPGQWSTLPQPARSWLELEELPRHPGLAEVYQREADGELAQGDLELIEGHTSVVRLRAEIASSEAATHILLAGAELVERGGAAVRVLTAGQAYSAREWVELARRGRLDALLYAFVTIEADGPTAWSRGMHVFGLKDAALRLAPGHSHPDTLLKLFLVSYLQSPEDLGPGSTFSSTPLYGDHLYSVDDGEPPTRAWSNPYGWWSLGPSGPLAVSELQDVGAISAAGQSLALLGDGSVRAWGANHAYSAAPGSSPSLRMSAVEGLTGPARAVSAGGRHSLVLLVDGSVMAFGDNHYGQLGGRGPASERAVHVDGLSDVVAVAAGSTHSLALRADGIIWSWGSNVHGELGDGHRLVSRPTPVAVAGIEQPAQAVAAGAFQSVALLADGSATHWGAVPSTDGRVEEWHLTPTVLKLPAPATAVAVNAHLLALLAEGTVWAGGANFSGQLGDGTRTARSALLRVALPARAVAVAAGNSHSLALLEDGTVASWGHQFDVPTPVVIDDVVAISAGLSYSLAVHRNRSVSAWGSNRWGQLGIDRHREGPSLGDVDPPPLTSRSLATFKNLAVPSVRLRGLPGHPAGLGRTKLGGDPDLPTDVDWPAVEGTPQAFIAQVDLSEIHVSGEPVGGGLLSFFCDSEFRIVDGTHDEVPCTVLAIPAGAQLVRRPPPDQLNELWRFPELDLQPEAEVMDIPPEAWEVDRLGLKRDQRWAWTHYLDREDESPRHRVLGYPEPIQNEPRRRTDETLLLQVDADDDAGMDWGDCGRIFYLVREGELAALRLGDVRLVYQCH